MTEMLELVYDYPNNMGRVILLTMEVDKKH